MSEPRRDEVAAALSARRDLGPEYDEAIAERLADRMHDEITRQVEARLAQERASAPDRLTSNQRVAITIVALGTGFLTTAAVVAMDAPWIALLIWLSVALIGLGINLNRR